MVIERKHKLTVMLSEYEDDALKWLADREGFSVSDYLRKAIRDNYSEAVFEEQRIRKGEIPRQVIISSADPPRRPGWTPGDVSLPGTRKKKSG
jgi:hypothetical protein